LFTLDESLKVSSVNSPLVKSDHPVCRLKHGGHGHLWFALDESLKANSIYKHETAL